MSWYFGVFKKYFNFKGRARRTEYWMFQLVNFVVIGILQAVLSYLVIGSIAEVTAAGTAVGEALTAGDMQGLLDAVTEFGGALAAVYGQGSPLIVTSILSAYYVLTFIPSLALTVRRLHDTGKSGAFIFMPLIPLVGGIIYFVFLVTSGHKGENHYGADPRTLS